MGTLRRQSVQSMQEVAAELAMFRVDSEFLGEVTPEALAMSAMFEASLVAPAGRNTKNGARDAMRVLAAEAVRNADGVGELSLADIYPSTPEAL
jgi:hypothetical protein